MDFFDSKIADINLVVNGVVIGTLNEDNNTININPNAELGLETGSSGEINSFQTPDPYHYVGFVCLTTEPDYDTYVWTYDEDKFERVTETSEFGAFILERYKTFPSSYYDENTLYLYPKECEIYSYYLGSLNEMVQLQSILASSSALRTEYGFDDDLYWTSTEVDGDTAKVIDMETGDDYDVPKDLVATSYDALHTLTAGNNTIIGSGFVGYGILITEAWADNLVASNSVADLSGTTGNTFIAFEKSFNRFVVGAITDLDGVTLDNGYTLTWNAGTNTLTLNNGTVNHTITIVAYGIGTFGEDTIYTPKTRAIRDFRSTIDYADKDELQGGVVFYKDTDHYGAGDHRYFVAYTEDSEDLHTWGTMATATGGTGTVIGTGETNTSTILAADPTAEAFVYVNELFSDNGLCTITTEDLVGTTLTVTKKGCIKTFTLGVDDITIDCTPLQMFYNIIVIEEAGIKTGLFLTLELYNYLLADIGDPMYTGIDIKIVGSELLYGQSTNVLEGTYRDVILRQFTTGVWTGGVKFKYPISKYFQGTVEVTLSNGCIKKFYIEYEE